MPPRGILIVEVAALGWDLVDREGPAHTLDLRFHPAQTVFPALTCPVQASLRTGHTPEGHGLWANGVLFRSLGRVFFWEQSARLVRGRRLWDSWRRRGGRVGLLFWQQSLGEDADLVLTPRPIHAHSGGLIPDAYSRPAERYAEIRRRLGRVFPLHRYWGPMAGAASSEWIVLATEACMEAADAAPWVLFTYLPHLDYDLQRYGPDHPRARRAFEQTLSYLQRLVRSARANRFEVFIFGDYAMAPVKGPPVFANRTLRSEGWLRIRSVRGRAYPEISESAAFVVADHEVALVYVLDSSRRSQVVDRLRSHDGIHEVLELPVPPDPYAADRWPDLLLLASEGRWFAYEWWATPAEAPDYARHVDIHNKPGYDPCELFWRVFPFSVGGDPLRVRGTQGRAGAARRVAWASTLALEPAADLEGLMRNLFLWAETLLP